MILFKLLFNYSLIVILTHLFHRAKSNQSLGFGWNFQLGSYY
jgi:hypothetical protein